MNIVSNLSNKYINQLINLMYSVRKYNNDSINWYIFTIDGFKKDKILRKTKQLNINVFVYVIDNDFFDGKCNLSDFSIMKYLPVISYFKMFAPFVLDSVDRFLYLDTDMVINGNLMNVYNIDLTGKVLAASHEDLLNESDEKVIIHKNNLGIKHPYFNAGFLLVNCELFRKKLTLQSLLDFSIKNKDLIKYVEQDVINSLLSGDDYIELSTVYNYTKPTINLNDKEKIITFHYPGPKKPWNHLLLSDKEKIYWLDYKKNHLFFWRLRCYFSMIPIYLKRIYKKIFSNNHNTW